MLRKAHACTTNSMYTQTLNLERTVLLEHRRLPSISGANALVQYCCVTLLLCLLCLQLLRAVNDALQLPLLRQQLQEVEDERNVVCFPPYILVVPSLVLLLLAVQLLLHPAQQKTVQIS